MCSPMPDIPDDEIEFTDADIVRMIKQDLEDGLYNEASLNERERQYLALGENHDPM